MKTEYYVATVVATYRRALDLLARDEQAFRVALPQFLQELECASHRDSDMGFLLGNPKHPGGAEGFHQSAEYVARVMTASDAEGIARVQLKNRFYAGDVWTILQPDGVHTMTAPRFKIVETGEELDTYGVAGTLLELRFPFSVAPGDLIRGAVRNHRA